MILFYIYFTFIFIFEFIFDFIFNFIFKSFLYFLTFLLLFLFFFYFYLFLVFILVLFLFLFLFLIFIFIFVVDEVSGSQVSTSRIFLKPKVRDTAEKVSSSVCSGGDNDDFDIDLYRTDDLISISTSISIQFQF